jgi:hypothetical protein
MKYLIFCKFTKTKVNGVMNVKLLELCILIDYVKKLQVKVAT